MGQKSVIPAAVFLAFGGVFAATNANAAPPQVVTTIPPVHALVANVMEGVGEPTLLLKSNSSPHNYTLKPSDARSLDAADIVFWVGESLETFMHRPLEALASDALVVELMEAPGLSLIPVRSGGGFEAHAHDEDHDDHAHGEDHDKDHDDHAHDEDHDKDHDDHAHDEDHDKDRDDHAHDEEHEEAADGHHDHAHEGDDPHIWLNTANAQAITQTIVATLSQADPENAGVYEQNGQRLEDRLQQLSAQLAEQLMPVKERPYIVFHDAYQYFEVEFGLSPVGSITLHPDQPASAADLASLQDRMADTGTNCLFREPQFEPGIIQVLVENTDAQIGTLDPLGGALNAGPGQYFELMQNMADSIANCLTPKS